MNDAAEVRADGRHFMRFSVAVAVDRNFVQSAANNRATPRLDLVSRFYFAGREPINILSGHIKSFLGECAGRPDWFSRGAVQRFPWVSLAEDQIGEQHAGNRAVGNAHSGIARGDEYVFLV